MKRKKKCKELLIQQYCFLAPKHDSAIGFCIRYVNDPCCFFLLPISIYSKVFFYALSRYELNPFTMPGVWTSISLFVVAVDHCGTSSLIIRLFFDAM